MLHIQKLETIVYFDYIPIDLFIINSISMPRNILFSEQLIIDLTARHQLNLTK